MNGKIALKTRRFNSIKPRAYTQYIPSVQLEVVPTGSGQMMLPGEGLGRNVPLVPQSNPVHVKMQQVAVLQGREEIVPVVSQDASGLSVAPCMAPQSTPELAHGMILAGVVQQRSGFEVGVKFGKGGGVNSL